MGMTAFIGAAVKPPEFIGQITGVSPQIPADTLPGDLILYLYMRFTAAGIPSDFTPSGYSVIANLPNNSNYRTVAAYKIAVSGDAGSVPPNPGFGGMRYTMAVFRPYKSISSALGVVAGTSSPTVIPSGSGSGSAIACVYVGFNGVSISGSPSMTAAGGFFAYRIMRRNERQNISVTSSGSPLSNISFYFNVS